jgi:thioredoxin reductase
MPPGTSEITEDVQWLINQMHKLQVTVRLNTPADGARILSENPDGVIIATGAIPSKPDIAGVDKPHVVLATDLLAQRVEPGQSVVSIGGGGYVLKQQITLEIWRGRYLSSRCKRM